MAAGLPLGPSHNRLPFPVAGLTHWPPDLLRSLEDPCRVEEKEGLVRVSRFLWPCKKAPRW